MKRLWIVIAILVLGLALLATACGTTEESTTTGAPTTATPATSAPTTSGASTTAASDSGGAKQIIAVCLPAMDNPLMLEIKDTFVKNFGAEYDVQVSSADGNPNTQSNQVENYTAMKVKFLCVMAVEATSLLPKLEAARAAGVITMVIGGEPGASGRDAVMKMDQYLGGAYCAWMGKQWVEATFPGRGGGIHRDRRLHLAADHRGGAADQGPAHDQLSRISRTRPAPTSTRRATRSRTKKAPIWRASPTPTGWPTRSTARR